MYILREIFFYLQAIIKLLAGLLFFIQFSYAQIPSSEIDLTAQEQNWLLENYNQKTIVGNDWAPVNYFRDGEAAGFSVDYLNLVAKKTGLNIEYITASSWEASIDQLRNGEASIGHGLMKTEERASYLNFFPPYFDLPVVFFGRMGSSRIESLEDLTNKKIGVIGNGNASRNYKSSYPTLNYVDFESYVEALLALSSGSVDVVIISHAVANYTISINFISRLEVIGNDFLLSEENLDLLHLAVSKNEPILYSILEKGINAVTEREYIEIANKWLVETQFNTDIGLTLEERDWLSKNKTIRVASALLTNPYEFVNENGEVDGVSGAYLKEISKRLNIEFVWSKNQTWSEGLEKIRSGDAEILSAVTETEERKEFLIFTEPYMSHAHVIFAREGNNIFSEISNLNGYTVAQSRGTVIFDLIKNNYPDIKIIAVDNYAGALELVSTGQADAMIGDIPSVSNSITNLGYTNINIAGTTPFRTSNSMAARSDLPLLASAMKKALADISPAMKEQILNEWFSLKIEPRTDYELIWKVVAGAAALIIFILFWLNKLRREVNRREIVEQELLFYQKRVESALEEANDANKAKSSFLANMSHEIRTPLNAIIGFSEVMSQGLFGEIKQEKYQEYLNDIMGSGQHLAAVIKNILDLSKIEAGKWTLEEEEFDLKTCVNDVFNMLRVSSDEKGIILNYQSDQQISLTGDVHAFKRIFINLCNNSIKFTDRGGKISCIVSKNEQGNVNILIKDNGIGIPEDRLDYVLRPFRQNHETMNTNESGTGLGLYIVKQLVELHNGEFSLKSELGIGTEAIIILPASRAA